MFFGFYGSQITSAQQGWFQQVSQTTGEFNSCYFFNEDNGIVVGSTILGTTNGGEIWNTMSGSTSGLLLSVHFANNVFGWAVGYEGTLIKTTNSGLSWFSQNSSVTDVLRSVWAINEYEIWIVGDNQTVLKSTTGGVYWEQINIPSIEYPNTIQFVNSDTGWIGGIYGLIKTTDAGLNWDLVEEVSVVNFFFIDLLKGWLIYRDDTGFTGILKTEDGGLNWVQQLGAGLGYYNKLFFIDEFKGWTVGWGGEIKNTVDGGQNWILQESNTTSWLLSVFFVDENIGWAVGQSGTILKTTNGGTTFVENDYKENERNNFSLFQNYPNPFNPTTNIGFQIAERGFVSLKVYDVLGNEVATLVNEELSAGEYEVEFSPESSIKNPASRIYFYQLKTGNFIQTKKMILIK